MKKVSLKEVPNLVEIQYICERLRERDHEEIFATRWSEDTTRLAYEMLQCRDFMWVAYYDNEPVALIGAYAKWPGSWSVFAFGTDKWPKVVLSLSRHVKNFMIPALYNAGALRCDCHALETHEDARRWLKFLGASEGPPLDNYGKNGQTFVCYSWTREETKGRLNVL